MQNPPEDHQTKTVDGAAAFQRGRNAPYYWDDRPRNRSIRTDRSSLHPNDPNYIEPPEETDED